ncbi:MAG: PLP-dependent aminotransferase family protein [Flavobacteriales bacterium]|nr:PLP-dependent aminotransferase family protein [Flavobacteriales bacterium]
MRTGLRKIARSYEEMQSSSEKKYVRLFRVIRDLILNGEIPDQMLLPPSRILADKLGLSRSTVVRAYEALKYESLISGRTGSGYRIRSPEPRKPAPPPPDTGNLPELSTAGKAFVSNINLINSTEDESIAFRPGLPPLDIFPLNQWKRLSNNYWKQISLSSLAYSATAGLPALRHSIADYLAVSRGVKCSPEQVFIVSGSLQSLYLIGKAFINPGDVVVLENPTFPNVHSIFKSQLATLCSAAPDQHGLDPDQMEVPPDARVKIMHLSPSAHYPTGVRMSTERKRKVLNWAREQKCLIIENDYEAEINNYGRNDPTIFSLDPDQRTIYLGTFNRILHPSLRIGYMVAPVHLIDVLDAIMRHSHRFVAPSIQVVLNQFIEKQLLWQHVNRLNEVVDERRELFAREMRQTFEGILHMHEGMAPGLQLMAHLEYDLPDLDRARDLRQKRIITHPLSKCFVSGEKAHGLIFGFSSVRVPVIRNRIRQMASILI